MVTVVQLRLKATDEDVWVLNTHWDDRGLESRGKAAEIILRLVKDDLDIEKGSLVVLLGDLNSPPQEAGYQILTGHRYASAKTAFATADVFLDSRHEVALGRGSDELLLSAAYGQYNTFTGFRLGVDRAGIIDVALVHDSSRPAGWKVDRYGVIPSLVEDERGYWLVSDHRLVVMRVTKSSS